MSRFGKLELGNQGRSLEREARAEPSAPQWLVAAEEAFARGEFEPALRQFARVLEYDVDQPAAWSGQVRALIELGELSEARIWADKALERFPSAPELLAAKAVALGRLGELDTALVFSDASIGERGDVPYLWLARGDVLLARGERRADYCFDRGVRDGARERIGGVARRTHPLSLRAVRGGAVAGPAGGGVDPAKAAVWLLCGDCQQALGFAAEAGVSFRQALDLQPDCRAAADRLAGIRSGGLAGALTGWWRRRFGS
ncbi:MAG: tetratricopeptide repeat protein [Verrucomicrobiota bacterium]